MKRSDQFERTTRDIVNAFLDLLGEKSFEKIIVQDIVDAAMINRSTFYQHFRISMRSWNTCSRNTLRNSGSLSRRCEI